MGWDQDRARLAQPLPRFYLLSVIGAILILALLLAERGLPGNAVFLALIAGLGVVWKSRFVPVLVLALVVLLVIARHEGYDLVSGFFKVIIPFGQYRVFWRPYTPTPLLEVVLALAVLVYIQGAFRLIGLLDAALPGEGRTRAERRTPSPREPGRVDATEGIQGLGVLLVVAILATGTWVVVSNAAPALDLPRDAWRVLLLTWLLATPVIVVTTVARILFWRNAPPEVQRLYLQETLWRETRVEQTTINRWLTAARLKAQKAKERS